MASKIKLKNLDSQQKYEIRTAVVTAAEKAFLAAQLQNGETAESLDDLLMLRKRQLGDVVYETALSAADKRFIATHPAWFRLSYEIEVVIWDGRRKHKLELPMSEERRLPAYMKEARWEKDDDEIKPEYFDALSAVSLGYRAIEAISGEYSTTIQQVTAEIGTVLSGKVNAEQAMRRWPGLEKVFPSIKSMKVEASQQLVVITNTLDKTFAAK